MPLRPAQTQLVSVEPFGPSAGSGEVDEANRKSESLRPYSDQGPLLRVLEPSIVRRRASGSYAAG
jgi:hypothetical protein